MSKTIRLAAPLQYESIADGPGFRIVLWTQGCRMKCPGCHNPQTHDIHGGQEYYIEDIKLELKENWKHHDGITLSGGDPFLQPQECYEIAAYAKNILGLNIWAYCGQTYEQLMEDPNKRQLLEICDYLVDGPFILAEADRTLQFRGSKNQRIINVQETLARGEIILYDNGR